MKKYAMILAVTAIVAVAVGWCWGMALAAPMTTYQTQGGDRTTLQRSVTTDDLQPSTSLQADGEGADNLQPAASGWIVQGAGL